MHLAFLSTYSTWKLFIVFDLCCLTAEIHSVSFSIIPLIQIFCSFSSIFIVNTFYVRFHCATIVTFWIYRGAIYSVVRVVLFTSRQNCISVRVMKELITIAAWTRYLQEFILLIQCGRSMYRQFTSVKDIPSMVCNISSFICK